MRGIVTGSDPGGVTVILAPTSLAEAAAAGAQPAAGVTDEATASGLRASSGAIGKIPSSAVRLVRAEDPPTVTTDTATDGTFSVAGIRSPGFYLLTFARAGYQTQRFVVNAATLADADPLEVALVAGQGELSGQVTGPSGAVGAAMVTITDGTVSLQTSSVSEGGDAAPGSWNVSGVSTPGTYLVSVASPGLGTASSLVTLEAGGTQVVDLSMVAGVASVTGQVSGRDQLGRVGGIGGIGVTVTGRSGDVVTTRTATTVTSGPVGRFTLPDLPAPGEYTLTVSGAGYQDQVRQVSIVTGGGSVEVDVSLTRADGVVAGTVSGDPAAAGKPAEGGLVGAGLTLTGPDGELKTMTTSDPPGAFRFTGVPPGVYVLAGTMFGRVPSSTTVEVTAAGDAVAGLTLISSADTELPATARIKGRVVDSRTGSTLTCDRAAVPGEECLVTSSVQVPAIDPATGRIIPGAPTQTVTAVTSPAEDYVLPAPDDKKHPGLVPGLYTVTLSAPGYEPGTTSVQVAQGQVVSAAPVSLAPLGRITGRITTRVGTPTGTTCVVATSSGGAAPDVGGKCTVTGEGATCTVGTDPAPRCAVVQEDGTYEIRGLSAGGYTVVVLPSDTEYIPPAPFDIQLELGSDASYDPILDRLGRIAVSVLAPDEVTAELAPNAGAEVTATGGDGPPPAATSDKDGQALLIGLIGSYTVQASGTPGSAEVTAVAVQLNQTVNLTMVLTRPIGSVVGRIVTNDGGPEPVGVGGVTVRITGLIGYSGASPISGFADLVTNRDGCFVILPTADTPLPVGTVNGCTFPQRDGSSGTINSGALIARPVSVFVPETDKTQAPLTATVVIEGSTDVKILPVITVLPKPSPTTGLTLTSNPATGPPSPLRAPATITVLTTPPGSGQVGITESITPDGASTLTWTDPTVGGTNLAAPGRYTIQASLPGWQTVTGTVNCPLGEACVVGAGGFTLLRNPTFTGTVTLLPTTDPADRSQAVYSVLSGPTPLPVIDLSSDAVGNLTWQEVGAPVNLVRPGTYRIGATLTGFESQPVTFVCGPPPGTCDLQLTLRRLAQATLTLRSGVGDADSVQPLGATVRLTGDTVGEQTLTAPANSAVIALPTLSTFDNSYRIEVTAAGFAPRAVGLADANCTGPGGAKPVPTAVVQPGENVCSLMVTQLGRIPVVTQGTAGPGGTGTALSSVVVTAKVLSSPDAPAGRTYTITSAADGTGLITGSKTQAGLYDGTYEIIASKDGYQTTTGTIAISGRAVSRLSGGISVDAGVLTAALTVTPVTLPVQLVSGGVGILPPGAVTIRGDNTSRTCTLVTTAGQTVCDPAEDGTTVQGAPVPQVSFAGLVPAVYTVSFTSSDNRYRPVTQQVQLFPGTPPPPVVLVLDLRASLQTGVVRDAAGGLLAGAEVSLRFDANVETIASDINGTQLPVVTTGSDGAFSFAAVPDGLYRVMVDAPGWNRAFSGTITLNSALTTTPPAVTMRLTRALRQVTLTVTSSAAPLAPATDQSFLANAPVTLIPVPGSQPPGAPENTALTGFSVSATPPYIVNAGQVPSGDWTASVNTGGSEFGPFVSTAFAVPDPDWPEVPSLTPPAFPPVSASVNLQQGRATITVSWGALCSPTSTPPATGTLPIVLTRTAGGATVELTAPVSSQPDGSGSAVVSVVLPQGAYTWAATLSGGWAGGSGGFTIPGTGTGIDVQDPRTLVPPVVAATASFSIDGAAAGAREIAAIPSGGGTTVTAQTDPITGVAPFCLPPGNGWTFRVRDTGSTPQILVPDRTGVSIVRAGPNAVAFIGFTFRPTATLQAVPRRDPDTTGRAVTLATSLGGTTVFSESVTIPALGTSVQGTAVVIGAGSYTVTATPAGTVFGPGTSTGVNPATTPAPTITMPYLRVLLTVLARTGGTPTPGAVVSLVPANGTGSPVTTDDPGGTATFRDIPAATYTVTATFSAGGIETFRGQLTGQVLAAGSSPQLTVPLAAVP